jgi:PAS domain S-box-containing protein
MDNGTKAIDPSLYRLLVEQARDYALFLLDPAGRIMTWNEGAERIKGYSAKDIVGRHFSAFYTQPAIDRGWPEYELKVAAAEGRFEDEGWRVRKDGSRFWASVVITALRDDNGKLLAFSKITRDLTDRKLQEEALRESEERFRLLVDGVVDYAIYMLDPHGIVTSWNAGAQRITGYTREEIVGKHFSRFYRQGDVEAGKPWEELASARRRGRNEVEGSSVRKDGSEFWARVVVSALYDATGRLHGYATITQDLTERRHLEALENAAKNVNEFIAVLAHELRNPLAPIRTAVQVMAQAKPGETVQQAMRETIDRQSAQLARILDDMLDISRVARGTLVLERKAVDVADVVRHAVETATPALQAGEHRIDVDLPRTPLVVDGDLHRLSQVVTNLLNNAARYTPPGGRITVTGSAEEGTAVLKVADTGCGIEPEMMERIFDMFVQGRAPLQSARRGLGIGLALARHIAELHHGTLTAYSCGPGKGSEFTLRLPLPPGASRTPHDDDAAQRSAGGSARHGALVAQRVLVVDDNVDAACSLELLLRSLGHETRVAHDGATALQAASDFEPDIVLLDIGMPDLDGYEVARRLRAQRNGRNIRIVAVTGWGQDADRERSREAGFDVHLVKPVGSDELARALDVRGGQTLH